METFTDREPANIRFLNVFQQNGFVTFFKMYWFLYCYEFLPFLLAWFSNVFKRHCLRRINNILKKRECSLFLSCFSFVLRDIKALANEDTLLRTHCCSWCFLGCANSETFAADTTCFWTKIRNIFCVPDTQFVSAANVARAGKWGNICVGNNVSATMCPRLPGLKIWYLGVRTKRWGQWAVRDVRINLR